VGGSAPAFDIAMLKISNPLADQPTIPIGSALAARVGQEVIAIGTPLGFLQNSVSRGIVSGLRQVDGATMIQTDAAINPGNSGGPLVDLKGRVIGINSRAVPVFGENVGFAIPINLVKETAKSLIAHGSVQRSWIGAYWQPLKVLPNYFDLRDKRGVLVGGVAPGSPAEQAGLEVGDLVLAFNGKPVTVRYEEELPAFRKSEADAPIGQAIRLSVIRRGETMELPVTTVSRVTEESEDFECREWGFTVRAINDEIARARNLDTNRGVIVTGVKRGSFAADAEFSEGDVILTIEGKDMPDLAAFTGLYRTLVDGQASRMLFVTKRGPILHYHVLKPSYGAVSPRAADALGDEDETGDPESDDSDGSGGGM